MMRKPQAKKSTRITGAFLTLKAANSLFIAFICALISRCFLVL